MEIYALGISVIGIGYRADTVYYCLKSYAHCTAFTTNRDSIPPTRCKRQKYPSTQNSGGKSRQIHYFISKEDQTNKTIR
jgi:hypothetical protein